MNDVIFIDGDFAIIRTEAIFCIGFNCYKATKPGGSDFVKINDIARWFKTEDAARKWLADFMANADVTGLAPVQEDTK